MSYHNILSKTDRALMAFIISKGAGTAEDTFPAKRSQGKTVPCTVCWSEEFSSAAHNAAAFRVKASILVRTQTIDDAGETEQSARVDSETRVRSIFDCFIADDEGKLCTDITTAARAISQAGVDTHSDMVDFTCLSCTAKGGSAAFEENTDIWVDTLDLELVCVPSNVD